MWTLVIVMFSTTSAAILAPVFISGFRAFADCNAAIAEAIVMARQDQRITASGFCVHVPQPPMMR